MFTSSHNQISDSTSDLTTTNNSTSTLPSINSAELQPSIEHHSISLPHQFTKSQSFLDTTKEKKIDLELNNSLPSSTHPFYFNSKHSSIDQTKYTTDNTINNNKKRKRKPRSRGKNHYPSVGGGHSPSNSTDSALDSKYYNSDSTSNRYKYKKKQLFNFVKPSINQRISKTMSGFNLKLGKRRRKSATPTATDPPIINLQTNNNGYNLPQSKTTESRNSSTINIDSDLVSGVCPKCATHQSLLDFVQTKNKASHLTELRDKLMQLESLASHIRQQMYSSKSYVHPSL